VTAAPLRCYSAPGEAHRALWTGRIDGDAPEVQRWHQAVQFLDLTQEPEHYFDPTVCLIGYASDLGVRANLGRPGAADGPARLRARMARARRASTVVRRSTRSRQAVRRSLI
jgi:hypothetical protein